jgi:hypothetical protein
MIPRFVEDKGVSVAVKEAQATVGVIEDYRLEELLRCPFRVTRPRKEYPGQPRKDVSWRQLVQYSASYIVNDYFSLPPEQRSAGAIERSAYHRWSNRAYKFESADHYKHMRAQTVSNLTRFLQEGRDLVPMVLFESFRRYIPSVESDVSFIVQMLHRTGGGSQSPYVIHKYLVDDDPGVIIGFRHLAVLFCSEAFGALPGRIEVFGVLSGNRYVFRPGPEEVAKAADYIRLLRDYMPEAGAGPRYDPNRPSVCGKCALRTECDRSARHDIAPSERRILH